MKLPKQHFGEWFQRHHQEYLTLNKKSKKEARYWLQEMNAHLRACFKYFKFSLVLPDIGVARLIVTVKGNERYFKKVDAWVATAPNIPGWSIQALEGPIPVDLLLGKQLEVAGINLSDLHFSLSGDQAEETTVTMYHPRLAGRCLIIYRRARRW